jgi:hypothetical protein
MEQNEQPLEALNKLIEDLESCKDELGGAEWMILAIQIAKYRVMTGKQTPSVEKWLNICGGN